MRLERKVYGPVEKREEQGRTAEVFPAHVVLTTLDQTLVLVDIYPSSIFSIAMGPFEILRLISNYKL